MNHETNAGETINILFPDWLLPGARLQDLPPDWSAADTPLHHKCSGSLEVAFVAERVWFICVNKDLSVTMATV